MLLAQVLQPSYLAICCHLISIYPNPLASLATKLAVSFPNVIGNTSSVQRTSLASVLPNASSPASDRLLDVTPWPQTPFQVSIPIVAPPEADYTLNILSAYPVLPSLHAKAAISSACHDMILWVDTYPPLFESYISRSHSVIQEFDNTGIVTLDLVPGIGRQRLSRRLALRGFEVFRALVQRYGEAELRLELSEGKRVRGMGRVNVRS